MDETEVDDEAFDTDGDTDVGCDDDDDDCADNRDDEVTAAVFELPSHMTIPSSSSPPSKSPIDRPQVVVVPSSPVPSTPKRGLKRRALDEWF